jgi:CRP-like cAMP-binding protein
MSLLDERPRSATVRATEETKCMAFYRWDFIPEVKRNPDLALALLAGLSRLVRELDAQVAGG